MAYNEELAERIRGLLAEDSAITERKMFGGLAFLIHGHMAVAACDEGLMVRVDRADAEQLIDDESVLPVVMGKREIRGWIVVNESLLTHDRELRRWVNLGKDFVRALPPKTPKSSAHRR